MSPKETGNEHLPDRFPRVSGDEPAGEAATTGTIEFSPRERG